MDNSESSSLVGNGKQLKPAFKWQGWPGRALATSVGMGYTALIFAKMPKPKPSHRPVYFGAFAAGACVNCLLCNLLFSLIEDEMTK
jgi:hypothetical protein